MTKLSTEKKVISCKWIFIVKYNSNGSVNKLKAWLVARGFTQSYGIDYEETFAPVAKLNTVRVLLSITNLDWPLYQLDVKNAFLNEELEEVYLEIPLGFDILVDSNSVFKLKKSLYELKQSAQAWFDRFIKAVKRFDTHNVKGITQCSSIILKQVGVLYSVYVDDIILIGDHHKELSRFKDFLAKEFEIKDIGNLKHFIGMEIARSQRGILVSQRKYVVDLLKEIDMIGCKPGETPMDTSAKFGAQPSGCLMDKGRYQRLVGKLIYLSHTWPDISFALSVVSQFMNNPVEEHMEAVYQILRHLKLTLGQGLFFNKTGERRMGIFTDAN